MNKFLLTLVLLVALVPSHAKIAYVKANATGANNGSSWTNAFLSLDSALNSNLHKVLTDTIWVANGTYNFPVWWWAYDSLKIYGGFVGTETSLSQRNWTNFQTVIYQAHSLWLDYWTSTSLLDFRIDGFKFMNNTPAVTGLLRSSMDKAVFANCMFVGNSTISPAIMIYSLAGTVDISNCQFVNNSSVGYLPSMNNIGGAIHASGKASVNITDCLFKNCSAANGGALYLIDSGLVTINRCAFYGCEALQAGGAIFDTLGVNIRVYNSLLVGNKAPRGGAHYSGDTTGAYRPHTFIHCTIANNLSSNSSYPLNYAIWLRGGDVLRNCILWGDSVGSGQEVASPAGGAVYNRNLIGGTTVAGATGTMKFNPMFLSAGTAAVAPFASSSSYNYHLNRWSGAIDTGVNLVLASPFNLDLDGQGRVFNVLPDLGAYEWKTCSNSTVSIAASGPTNFCIPGSVVLTASPTQTPSVIQWNGGTVTGSAITASSTGIYKTVCVDTNGCRSTATVIVVAEPMPTPTITQTANTLSVPAIYASYQWYNGAMAIAGATAASYNPTTNGTYSVKVTTLIAACPGTSAAYVLTNLAASTIGSVEISVYPNPANGYFIVEGATPGTIAKLCSSVGQQLETLTIASTRQRVSIETLPPGLYLLKLSSASGATSNVRILKL